MAYLMKTKLCNRCPHFERHEKVCNLGCTLANPDSRSVQQKWTPEQSAACNSARKTFSLQSPDIRMIAALDRNGAIGKNHQLPFRLPSDLQHFKKTTEGGVLIMGRKTFESLPGVLPGRPHWVLSRRPPQYAPKNVTFFRSVRDILAAAVKEPSDRTLWVIGGGEVYRLFLPYAEQLILSDVDTSIKGADTYFPNVPVRFTQIRCDNSTPAPEDEFSYTIRHLQDLSKPPRNSQ